MDRNGFAPGWWLRNGDVQTFAAGFLRPGAASLDGAGESIDVPVAPGSAVRLVLQRPSADPRGLVLILHGLGGSAESGTAIRAAAEALARGWIAVRMNYRNCGGTAHLARTYYNAGMSGDVAAVIEALRRRAPGLPIAAIGWSLGGSILLKYLGEASRRTTASVPRAFSGHVDGPGRAGRALGHLGRGAPLGAAAVLSPAIDLESGMRCLERPRNLAYNFFFVRSLLSVARDRHRLDGGEAAPSFARTPTVRAFDDLYVAPDAGYAGASDYYAGASPAPGIERIDVPTLILASRDDPVVPVEPVLALRDGGNALTVRLTDHGGHCGWFERAAGGAPGASADPAAQWKSWACRAAMQFLEDATAE